MGATNFTLNRAQVVDHNFVRFCREAQERLTNFARRDHNAPLSSDPHAASELTGAALIALVESQFVSRHLDLMARELRKQDRGYYTIGSSGHEGNAVVGRLTRHTDPAFLHYRSGAFMAERARQVPEQDFIRDTLLGMMASTLDPIAGGRHKVWGSVPLCVPPQTSTISSHLPRAVGAGLALERARKLGIRPHLGDHGEIPGDAVVVCSFGDASVNHSVAQGAFNTACYASFQNLPAPVLFVCEDNGIGISVHSPPTWVEASFAQRPGITYFKADGLNLTDAFAVTEQAVRHVRTRRRPALLHLKLVRLLGHAGSDVETEYHSIAQIEANEARDPLLRSAALLIESGLMRPGEVLELYEAVRARVADAVQSLGQPPLLRSAAEVIAPLAPYTRDAVQQEAARPIDAAARAASWGGDDKLPELQPARHLAVNINRALHDLMLKYPEMLIFGEDVAQKGGVYHVTTGLTAKFGVARVFNTMLDETSILGMAIGAAHLGLLPVPEIQYLAYVHNAIDQLRGEACSSNFFSCGQFPTPMVVRINSLGYQKGFGGHFHNDNSIAALRDIPGLVVCVPSRGDDAARMLRTCLALSKVDGRVVAFLEPIALYMTKDLYEPGDGQWQFSYPPPHETIEFGEGAVYEPDASEVTIFTYGNGVYLSLRASKMLREQTGIRARVVDLRWLTPLNAAFIAEQFHATGAAVVVDEGRFSGGVSEAILAHLLEAGASAERVRRVTGADTYIPLGPAANLVLPSEADIVAAVRVVCAGRPGAVHAVAAAG